MIAECQPRWAGPILRGVVLTPGLTSSVAAYRDGLGGEVEVACWYAEAEP